MQNINATVSHEMRNPLNSILSQSMKMKEMLRLIRNLLQDNQRMAKEVMKKEALRFVSEMDESLEIQVSSTKMLDFCVNDMLSFGQLNTPGKFRKNCSLFNV